ncbi:trans-resveratrol di-O-methyltransferase-like [Cucumis melo var. makuwa]|uniref:Trans-resveratrol di-O-methyltransferase-like n=1 Tax=Cucumis melo var. makuwa TaxID=1194695 RepID=A0A5A7UWR4_CUCMM|nr:trans-resveratrol di-O-methyltransferase-like [Cucumis melo var. makuwa]
MNMEAGGKKLAMGGDELLEAQSHIWNHIFNFINSMSLKCAIQLGIPDAIHSHGPNPMPLSLLKKDTFLPIHLAFFLKTILVLYLLSYFPCSNQPSQIHFSSSQSGSKLTTKRPSRRHMECRFGSMGNKAKDGEVFNEGMASDARLVISVLLGKYKSVFEGVESLVDVGGGTGTMAKAISQAFPQMECTVFDLPQVVAHLKEDQPNFKYVEGDMFKLIPPADTILLKWILHDWSDEECVKILKNCKEAITSNGKKGKVMVIDLVLFNTKNDQDSIESQLFFDMLMMVEVGGKEREEKEWAKLVKEAGFSAYKIFPILGLRSLIEIYP